MNEGRETWEEEIDAIVDALNDLFAYKPIFKNPYDKFPRGRITYRDTPLEQAIKEIVNRELKRRKR